METIARRLKRLRTDAGLTQIELASLARCSQSNITAYERGHSVPSRPSIERLAVAFGISTAAFADCDFTKANKHTSRQSYTPTSGGMYSPGFQTGAGASPAEESTRVEAASGGGAPASSAPVSSVYHDAHALDAAVARAEALRDALMHAILINTDDLRALRAERLALAGAGRSRPRRHGGADVALRPSDGAPKAEAS